VSPDNETLLIDVGSTFFKLSTSAHIEQHARDFNKEILADLMDKCGETIARFDKGDVYICSSANGGLSTLIVGISNSFSLRYATNIALNSGINIIDTVLYQDIAEHSLLSDLIDVVIIVGGIDSHGGIFDDRLFDYLEKLNYSNVVFVGSVRDASLIQQRLANVVVLPNIIDTRLHMVEDRLRDYLTHLYQQDIEGKRDIKHLYDITDNQIFSTPYIVNRALPFIGRKFPVANPFLLLDIGGATTDVHYSKDLVEENIVTENEYDRLVFKKLGVYKSRQSLIFAARANEFVYELAIRTLMQLAIFLALYKISHHRDAYINLKLLAVNSIVLTGGITKVLDIEKIEDVIAFFYRKALNSEHRPTIILDLNYDIWTLGARGEQSCQ